MQSIRIPVSLKKDFQTFKKSFFTEVNVFKKQLLTSYTTDNVNKSNNSDRLIILLEENIAFLKEQINKKDKVIDSLLNQLSKQNDSAPHNKTSNTISTQTELITDSKLTESSNKSEKNNTEGVKNENKNITHTDPKQSAPLHKKSDNASTKENAENSEDNSSINSRDINSKSKKLIVILDYSMLKHLNDWEISKKFKNACKIFVKHFSSATTNCMEDYIKLSLRKDPNHIILHLETND